VTVDNAQNVGVGVTPSAWGSYKAIQLPNGVSLASFTVGAPIAYLTSNSYFNGTNDIYVLTGSAASAYQLNQGVHKWYNAPSGTAGGTITYTQAMTLDASGNLLVGGTLNTAAAGICCNSTNGISIERSGAGYRQIYIASSVLYFYNGSNQASLSSAGAWTNASDARLKKNITEIKYGLNTVVATQPRSYERNDVEGQFIGFVAQELKEQIPEVVFGSEDEQYTVDYGSLVAVAFKAIQEQQILITSLTERITALEAK
jgi:Chaperone of endosialidase